MTAPLADRDLQLLDRYVDGALEGPALDALRARLAAEPALRAGLQQRNELRRTVRASADVAFSPRAGFADRVLAASRRLPEPEQEAGVEMVRLCKRILWVAAAVFAAAMLWQGAMTFSGGSSSLQAAPDEAQRIVDDLDARIRERATNAQGK
jgi:anti-sigma factor RsiW